MRDPVRIHLMSDSHFSPTGVVEFPKCSADICVLGGDIFPIGYSDLYEKYILRLKEHFEEVIFIAGNHEFYGSSYDETIEGMKSIAERTGAHFLDIKNNPSFFYKGVKFWGSTLWTDFGEGKHKTIIGYSLNDYRATQGLTTDIVEEIHDETVEKIEWDADVIITHHMPVLREHSRIPMDAITYGFCCTDLEETIKGSGVKFWLYGHTHDNRREKIGETQLISNQRGYQREMGSEGYDPYLVLEV